MQGGEILGSSLRNGGGGCVRRRDDPPQSDESLPSKFNKLIFYVTGLGRPAYLSVRLYDLEAAAAIAVLKSPSLYLFLRTNVGVT